MKASTSGWGAAYLRVPGNGLQCRVSIKTIRDVLIPTMAKLGDLEVMLLLKLRTTRSKQWHRSRQSWELAVVDLFLKEGYGLDVLRACRGRRSGCVVVLSNYATQ